MEGVDSDAHRAVEQLGHTLYDFGCQAEPRLGHRERQLFHVNEVLQTVRGEAQQLGRSLNSLQHDYSGLVEKGQVIESDLGALREEVGHRLTAMHQPQADILRLQEDVQSIRLEGRRRAVELEANVMDNTKVQELQVKTDLSQVEGRLHTQMQHNDTSVKTWVHDLLLAELSPLRDQVQQLTDKVSEITAHGEQLAELADAQATLMHTVEQLTTREEYSEIEEQQSLDLETLSPRGPPLHPFLGVEDSVMSKGSDGAPSGKQGGSSLKMWPQPIIAKGTRQAEDAEHYMANMPPTAFAKTLPHVGEGSAGEGSRPVGVGQMKLDAPPRYTGARRPGARVWLQQMERYMRLMRYAQEDWLDIVAMRVDGAASAWMNSILLAIQKGRRPHF